MKRLSKNALIGYPAGIITGITYGLNPLFGMPLMQAGASIYSILFFRYIIAVVLLGGYLLCKKESFRLQPKQMMFLLVLGVLYTLSSLFLFEAYKYIPSGLATTLIFLYPVLVAIIMVFRRVIPSLPVWISIAVTFIGVVIMTRSDSSQTLNMLGVLLSLGSAFVYALFIVIVNQSKTIGSISSTMLTFYSLLVGSVIFLVSAMTSDTALFEGIEGTSAWMNLVGLAILPTIISTSTLAIASRNIGATKASVLGVFEPITAILVGTVVFGETLTTNIIVGILLSVAAVTFMIATTKR